MVNNIPQELKALKQWVICTTSEVKHEDKIPINPLTRKKASSVDPNTWGTFEEACAARSEQCPHIAFVLTESDPYTIIDLDNPYGKDDWSQEKMAACADLNTKILNAVESYTEISQSGRGVHIITKGSIPFGVHRDSVEVYSDGRVMICTGNIMKNLPVSDAQPTLDKLYMEMKPVPMADLDLGYESPLSDNSVMEIAMNAANADKFNRLCNGEWQGEYPSQSEADFALLSMLTFYTDDNNQVMRIFRHSALGKREKAVKDNKYLVRNLKRIRANQATPVGFEEIKQRAAEVALSQVPIQNPPEKQEQPAVVEQQLDYPPGLIGDIARYVYDSSIIQVKEAALVTALGLFAGIVGRTYNISNTGLNQYIVYLGDTGSGKEGISSAIERITSEVRKTMPSIYDSIGPSSFSSGPALAKQMVDQPCFVSILGEFGFTLQRMCSPNASHADKSFKQCLLDIFQKSGKNGVVRPSVYSDKSKDTSMVQSPALSFIGESTPETFFSGLDEHSILDGFIPRITIIEYKGKKPYDNKNCFFPPHETLVNSIQNVAQAAYTLSNNNNIIDIKMTPDAMDMIDVFGCWSTDMVNSEENSAERQLWNRAKLKALKLAGLIAVGVNHHEPVVTEKILEWVLMFVRREIDKMAQHFKKGDLGATENKQLTSLKSLVSNYFAKKQSPAFQKFKKEGILPRKFLQQSLANKKEFKDDRRGATAALNIAVKELMDQGFIVEVPQGEMKGKFNTGQKAYALGDAWEEH